VKKTQKIAILVENNKAFKLLRRKLSSYKLSYERDNILFETDYRGIKILLLETGIGRENIDYRISRLLENHNIDFAIFLGFMGALEKDIKVGDIIIPSRFASILEPQEEYQSNPELLDFCQTLEKKNNFKLHFSKKNLTVDRVCLGDDKIRLKQANPGVSSVDMEAFRVAKRFSKERIPFIIAKAVFDEWDFAFRDFELLFNAENTTNLARLLFYCIRYPQEILNLINLVGNVRKALKNNIRFLESFLDGLI
jgi:nucleoside phosphorylase